MAAVATASVLAVLAGALTALPARAATNTLAPVSMTTTAGVTGSGQPVSNLAVQDQAGTADTYSKYVEFSPSGSTAYTGYRTYTLPSAVTPTSVTAVQIATNYRGPDAASQTWTWGLYNWTSAAWVNVGSNAAAASWGPWATFSFNTTAAASSYVSSTGSIRVRLLANNTSDSVDLDYESVLVTSSASADVTAPSVPAGVTVGTKTASSVALSWTASTDNVGVTGYEVFQGTGTTAVATVTATSATVTGLAASTTYSFTVKAKDAAGNRSAASSAVSATTTASGGLVLPPIGGQFDYQIGGGYTPASVVTIVDRDRLDPLGPLAGKYNICYVNTLQTQPDEAASYWPNVPGRSNLILTSGSPAAPVHDPDPAWAGEMLFDVRTAQARTNLMALEKTWITDCKNKGYNAIEPDNLDSWDRSTGLMTQAQDQAFMQLFVAEAHAQGMPVAQKNVPEWGSYAKTTIGFDFEITEECQESAGACQQSQTIYGNDLVFELEYWYETNDSSSGVTIQAHTFAHFTAACTARGAAIRITMRNREVIPAVSQPVVLSTAAQAGGFYYNAC